MSDTHDVKIIAEQGTQRVTVTGTARIEAEAELTDLGSYRRHIIEWAGAYRERVEGIVPAQPGVRFQARAWHTGMTVECVTLQGGAVFIAPSDDRAWVESREVFTEMWEVV